MTDTTLAASTRARLINRVLGRKSQTADTGHAAVARRSDVADAFTRFDQFPAYKKMVAIQAASKRFGLPNPFFRVHDGAAGATTHINGQPYRNFASYNYLGLAQHPEVLQSAKDALDRYGPGASASRLVAGERPIQRELEQEIARFYGVDDCVVFVSGHATNVSTISTLFGSKDLVVHDSLIHNSVLMGIQLSGATRRGFPHNDMDALDQLLSNIRGRFERVLIVAEGIYSMDGDMPNLPALVDIKQRHGAFLMMDEAHALGVLGATGRGIHEHYGIDAHHVDIWMGTLSKTLSGCGGYIAGERALVEHLKYAAPGFVYSVGISPVLAATSLAALRILQREPQRVHTLQQRSQQFLQLLQQAGFDTGHAQGYAVVPLIVGSSAKAVQMSDQLFQAGVNVQPIIYPAVEEKAARLRFFLSALHSPADLQQTLEVLEEARQQV